MCMCLSLSYQGMQHGTSAPTRIPLPRTSPHPPPLQGTTSLRLYLLAATSCASLTSFTSVLPPLLVLSPRRVS